MADVAEETLGRVLFFYSQDGSVFNPLERPPFRTSVCLSGMEMR
jgi:hypothetical protein